MTALNLAPCPFCGSDKIDVKGWASTETSGPACDECGGSAGSALDTPEQNIAAWNRRAPYHASEPDAVAGEREAVAWITRTTLETLQTGTQGAYNKQISNVEFSSFTVPLYGEPNALPARSQP